MDPITAFAVGKRGCTTSQRGWRRKAPPLELSLSDENPNTTDFGYTKSFGTDPSTANTFTLKDDGVQTFDGVLFGTGYTVVEDVIPAGWGFDNVNCSASTGVTPTINGATVTFAIDNSATSSTARTSTSCRREHSGSSRTAPRVVGSPSQVRCSLTTARA